MERIIKKNGTEERRIFVYWNCDKSIKKAERLKANAENAGFELIKTENNPINNTSRLIYTN